MIGVLFGLVVAILVVGFLCWLIRKMPVDEPFKSIAQGVLIFFLVFYVLFVIAALLGVTSAEPLMFPPFPRAR